MTELTAIDILILPDATMITHATAWNDRLREKLPSGFALDSSHTPHITLLQRYVFTSHLDDVYGVVGAALAAAPVATLQLTGVRLAHMEMAATPGVGLAGLLVQASPAVIDLQIRTDHRARALHGIRRLGGGLRDLGRRAGHQLRHPALHRNLRTRPQR